MTLWLRCGCSLGCGVQFGRFISKRVTCPAAGSSSDNSKQQQTNNRKQQTQPTPVLIFEGFLPHRHAAVRLWLPVSPTWQMWHWKSAMDNGGCLKWAGTGAQFTDFMDTLHQLFACLTTIFWRVLIIYLHIQTGFGGGPLSFNQTQQVKCSWLLDFSMGWRLYSFSRFPGCPHITMVRAWHAEPSDYGCALTGKGPRLLPASPWTLKMLKGIFSCYQWMVIHLYLHSSYLHIFND